MADNIGFQTAVNDDTTKANRSNRSGGLRRRIHLDSTYQHYPSVPVPIEAPDRVKQWWIKVQQDIGVLCEFLQQRSPMEWLEFFFPMVEWLRKYKFKADILSDIIAGITVAAVVIPQGIANSLVAGMPVNFGLFCSFVPVYAYSIFGTSRQGSIGSGSMYSLTFHSVVMPLVNPTDGPMTEQLSAEYIQVAIQLAFLVGIIFLIMGLFRLGFVTTFFSKAVLSGFITGAALINCLSQVKYILGIRIPSAVRVQTLLQEIFSNVSNFNYKTILLGCSSIVVFLTIKNVGLRYKSMKWIKPFGSLTVCILTILLSYLLQFQNRGIPIVGTIPSGLPPITIHQWLPLRTDLAVPAITLVVVGFLESIGTAQKFAALNHYTVDSSREFYALGAANFVGSMFSIYPVVVSLSRTAVNNEVGAKSQISSIISATGVMEVLLWLVFLFYYLPMCVVGAIVISGVLSCFEFGEFVYLWKIHKLDCLTWAVSFCVTIFVSISAGVLSALLLSLLIIQYENAKPHIPLLGRLPNSTVYRDMTQYSEAAEYPGLAICRIDASLYFCNAQYIREKLEKYVNESDKRLNVKVSYLIVDISPAGYIDSTAISNFGEIWKHFSLRGITLCFCGPSIQLMKAITKSKLIDLIHFDNVFSSEHHAVSVCRGRLAEKAQAASAVLNENIVSTDPDNIDTESSLGLSDKDDAKVSFLLGVSGVDEDLSQKEDEYF